MQSDIQAIKDALAKYEAEGPGIYIAAVSSRDGMSRIARLIEQLESYEEQLIEFADYENPVEPKYVCWPSNEIMKKSRAALAKYRGKK